VEVVDGRLFLAESGLDQRAVVTRILPIASSLLESAAKLEDPLSFFKLSQLAVVRTDERSSAQRKKEKPERYAHHNHNMASHARSSGIPNIRVSTPKITIEP
jgi:precorrin-4 methylase